MLFRAVTLPVHQVLGTTTVAAHVNDPPDRVGRVTVNELGGGRGNGRWAQRTATDRFDLRDMKHRVDAPGSRKPESDCRGTDDSSNLVGANVTGCQFPRKRP